MPERPPSCTLASDLFEETAFTALNQEQRTILRLYYRERWTLARIAQFLRVSLRTVKRHKAEALAAVQTTGQEILDAEKRKEGSVRLQVTIRQHGEVETRTDTTLSTAARLLADPAYREAYYAPDRSPEEVRRLRIAAQKRAEKKGSTV
jgi:hypothetical protein